ncbi:unnamed protein product [Triticum turgidum subsp. durum]|uniref:Protein kinase domain-containing protein n=1 Tax=Triticum turgidum subsp. durum TaxID=4567 RepID=A0A9R1RGC1_TRITD|nr:unnamed protein product [Triticum turgidum subsp. durum]
MLHDTIEVNDDQFDTECLNLACLQHNNIVQLVGYCHDTKREYIWHDGKLVPAHGTKRALCLEYMNNGTLDKFISDESKVHDWCTRFSIIKGICNGLKYLHKDLESPMYHLDLKLANILLNENMVPKIADFGLSRLFEGQKTQRTKSIIGTQGYLPPEYRNGEIISNKFDIYSLGVVIIKIMTGPRGYFSSAEIPSWEFIKNVHERWRKRLQVTSEYQLESYSKQVKRCIEIAVSCLETDRNKRPSIGDIVHELNKTYTMLQFGSGLTNDQGLSFSSIDQSPRLKMATSSANCMMLTSRSLRIANNLPQYWRWISLPADPRFAECVELLSVYFFAVIGEIPPGDLPAGTSYIVYLVYKLANSTSGLRGCVQTSSLRLHGERIVPGSTRGVSLHPEVCGSASDITYPVTRGDGWLELRLAEFENDDDMLAERGVIVDLREENDGVQKRGLIIGGMEFRSN